MEKQQGFSCNGHNRKNIHLGITLACALFFISKQEGAGTAESYFSGTGERQPGHR
jgi:hypothetical protein